MREVEDGDGRRYLLLKRSSSSSLLLDPETGARIHRPNDQLTGEGQPTDPRTEVLSIVRDRDAVSVRTLLDETTLCERDLHGILHALEASDELERTSVAGERAYARPGGQD